MKRFVIAIVVFLTAASAHAQQPNPPADPHHPKAEVQTTPAVPGPQTPQTGPSDGGMMAMMMCRDMMSGQSMGASAMPGQQAMDPRMRAQMMEMRGEMMKAMGDIMMKYAKKTNGMAPRARNIGGVRLCCGHFRSPEPCRPG